MEVFFEKHLVLFVVTFFLVLASFVATLCIVNIKKSGIFATLVIGFSPILLSLIGSFVLNGTLTIAKWAYPAGTILLIVWYVIFCFNVVGTPLKKAFAVRLKGISLVVLFLIIMGLITFNVYNCFYDKVSGRIIILVWLILEIIFAWSIFKRMKGTVSKKAESKEE